MATVAAIEGERQFALCHQSNQPTHIHKQMCMHHFHSNLSRKVASMLLNKINTITKAVAFMQISKGCIPGHTKHMHAV